MFPPGIIVPTTTTDQYGHTPVLVVTASSIFCVPSRDHGSRTKKEQEEVVSMDMDIDEPGEMLCVVCMYAAESWYFKLT